MDQRVKERVVGAAVLMTAAVIFVPMILSGPPPQRTAAPSEPAAAPAPAPPPRAAREEFSSRIVPLDERPTPARESPAREKPPAPEPPPEPAQAPVAQAPAAAAAAPAAAAPRKEPAPAPAAASPRRKGFVVQLGSFSNARNAQALRERLERKGYETFTVAAGDGADAVTRVYVGPEPDRARAERHLAELFRETRLRGIVVPAP